MNDEGKALKWVGVVTVSGPFGDEDVDQTRELPTAEPSEG